jgi:hypothetical protein
VENKTPFALYYERGKVNSDPALVVLEYVPPSESGWQFADRWCHLEDAGMFETAEQAVAARGAIQRATGKRHRYVIPGA